MVKIMLAALAFVGAASAHEMDWTRIEREMPMFLNGTNPKSWGGPFGHGTGTYRVANDKVVRFTWYGYHNSDGWPQIAISVPVLGFDLGEIRKLVDQHGRKGQWDAHSNGKFTWIGTSADLNDERFDEKYWRRGKTTKSRSGTSTPLLPRHDAMKADYLDRITKATRGALVFNVAQLDGK